jgi:hypothetical protein
LDDRAGICIGVGSVENPTREVLSKCRTTSVMSIGDAEVFSTIQEHAVTTVEVVEVSDMTARLSTASFFDKNVTSAMVVSSPLPRVTTPRDAFTPDNPREVTASVEARGNGVVDTVDPVIQPQSK